jgi:hypothetical protein
MDMEGVHEVDAVSPGFGSAANSFRDLYNVEEWRVEHSNAGLHRSRDPGAGGFSPFHNRVSTAKIPIHAGEELFVSYGDNWFHERVGTLGPIPVRGDLPKANSKLLRWDRLRFKHNITILKDLWETFVWNSSFKDVSREFFALPKDWDETEQVISTGLVRHRRNQSTRSLDWLKETGVCGDNIKEGLSTLHQAGRGAFATRRIPKGSVVAPVPVIQVPYRKRFDMYPRDSGSRVDEKNLTVVGQQLLLNYCFGHRDSTLLLCPYGLLTSLFNHNQTRANAKLQWTTKLSTHHPEWLNMTIPELRKQKTAGLVMEVVALRDIEKEEEVLIDYGDEWEEAWQHHVRNWRPLEGAENYQSSEDLNNDTVSILRTEFVQMKNPYPGNVELKFDLSFRYRNKWQRHMKTGTLDEYKKDAEENLARCDILRWREEDDGTIFYTIVWIDEEEKESSKQNKKVEDVPREAFAFVDRPYTSDYLQPNAFRHDIRIPDVMFPEAWKNLKAQQHGEEKHSEIHQEEL